MHSCTRACVRVCVLLLIPFAVPRRATNGARACFLFLFKRRRQNNRARRKKALAIRIASFFGVLGVCVCTSVYFADRVR